MAVKKLVPPPRKRDGVISIVYLLANIATLSQLRTVVLLFLSICYCDFNKLRWLINVGNKTALARVTIAGTRVVYSAVPSSLGSMQNGMTSCCTALFQGRVGCRPDRTPLRCQCGCGRHYHQTEAELCADDGRWEEEGRQQARCVGCHDGYRGGGGVHALDGENKPGEVPVGFLGYWEGSDRPFLHLLFHLLPHLPLLLLPATGREVCWQGS